MHYRGSLHNKIFDSAKPIFNGICMIFEYLCKLLNGRILFWGFVVLTVVLYVLLPYHGQGNKLACCITSQGAAQTKGTSTMPSNTPPCEVYKSPWNKSGDFTVANSQLKIKILLYGKNLSDDTIEKLKTYEYVYINSELTVPEENGNYHGFEMTGYLKAKDIDYVTYPYDTDIVFFDDLQLIQGENLCNNSVCTEEKMGHSILYYSAKVRQKIEKSLKASMSENTANLSMSVMTGDTAELNSDDKEAFQKSGMSHLMAVSGAHVAYVTKPVIALLSKIKIKKNGLVKRNLMLLPFVFTIAFVSGFSPSIMRASVMSSYGIFARVFKRGTDNLNSLGFAGILSLCINPFYIYDTGFVLSYIACISIYLILPKLIVITHKVKLIDKSKMARSTAESFLMGVSVNLGMLPVMINMFNGMSLIGLIVNVFASSIAEFICIVGYIVSILAFVGLPSSICTVFSYPVEFMSLLLRKTASGGKSGTVGAILGYKKYPSIPIVLVVIYYSILILIFACKRENRKKISAVIIMIIIPMIIVAVPAKAEFVFFDVGQGVSVLVKTRDGCRGLIDTGDGKTDVSSLLFKEGVGKLDFIILSHGHSDHYGGILKVIDEHAVDVLFVPSNPKDEWIKSFITENPKQNIRTVNENINAYVGKYLNLNLYCDTGNPDNLNNSSVVTFVSGQWGSVLLPGDIEEVTEMKFAENFMKEHKKQYNEIDLLCVSHHGSDTSSSEVFLETVSPKYAIISVGKNNIYGHPANEVVSRIEQYTGNDNVFRTDECGALRMTFGRFADNIFDALIYHNGEKRIAWQQKRKKVSA